LIAATTLVASGKLKALPGMDLRLAVTLLSLVYIPGVIVALLLPETKGEALKE
jgi:hypothetical protein